MGKASAIWTDPGEYLQSTSTQGPVLFIGTADLATRAELFLTRFPGLTTYALKANPDPLVLRTLCASGLRAFDVASPAEIILARTYCPSAALHYHNPVRSRDEIRTAVQHDVRSYSVDCHSELAKLIEIVPPKGVEVAVRFALPLKGASYDFGAKFGAQPDAAASLLKAVEAAGFIPTLTFHPGTQLCDISVWQGYIAKAAEIANAAGINIQTLNIGGGFPSERDGQKHDLVFIFDAIEAAVQQNFGENLPRLVCEPGRAMVADAGLLAVPVKSVRETGAITLVDGIYGALNEQMQIGVTKGLDVFASSPRSAETKGWTVFGPTCDSLDVLPGQIRLPVDIAEGDILLFRAIGAYSNATTTAFNGYGDVRIVAVHSVQSH